MLPDKYARMSISVKYFLSSYRALSDGRIGITHLKDMLATESFLLSDWKVIWIGTCTLIRTSIDLLQRDAITCINKKIREELIAEWKAINDDREVHAIFWDFLRKERNNVIHEYEWSAYEMWMSPEGKLEPAKISLLSLRPEDSRSVLVMRGGKYQGRDSLELLNESAEWAEKRIFNAIVRAGFSPDEKRNLITFGEPSPRVNALGL